MYLAIWSTGSSTDIRRENLQTLAKKTIEPAHKLKIDQNKLQNCRSNILNLVNVL
ncbi:hypothetical protein D1AOALGA4SA_5735 [Olavius algarvensis Delta 1 endosymbiont]|nr:hypothetical protein D1AOALGA4SA_5735 [Olavius algarvensis Delta 1 endosymbiont]